MLILWLVDFVQHGYCIKQKADPVTSRFGFIYMYSFIPIFFLCVGIAAERLKNVTL